MMQAMSGCQSQGIRGHKDYYKAPYNSLQHPVLHKTLTCPFRRACRALLGQKWRSLGDPCIGGPSARRTFMAQATFALPIPGSPGRFLLMADRWNQERLGVSRYIWLPMFVVDAPAAARQRAQAAVRSRVRRDNRNQVRCEGTGFRV